MRTVWRFLPILFGLALFLPALFSTHPVFSEGDSSVIINEIMYDPVESESYNEWIEVKNMGTEVMDLASWSLCTSALLGGYIDHSTGKIMDDRGTKLEPGKFALITDGGSGTDVYSSKYFLVAGEALALHVSTSSICGGGLTNNVGEKVVLSNGVMADVVEYQTGWGGGQPEALALDQSGSWRSGEPTPGALNEFPVGPEEPEEEEEDEEKPEPIVVFDAPSSVVADTPFAVTVNLENFDPGTYSLKVLIGSGDQFCDGRTEGVEGSWLACNAGWANFPTVTVDSSGLGSKVIEAKTDDDVGVGRYSIKIRVHGDTASFDSEIEELEVTVEAAAGSSTEEESAKDEEKAGPAITFKSPSSAVADTSFAVTVILKDFDPGTYSLKVLIGAGDQFYDGRTEGVGGGWLAWNAGWADFPKITVGNSGQASKTVRAKTDDDIGAGRYSLKIRAHGSKANFDSAAKELTVTADPAGSSSLLGEEKKDTSPAATLGAQTSSLSSDADDVLGAEDRSEANRKLNFYIILGVLGFAVGSGGLVVAFGSLSRHPKEDLGDCEGQIP